MQSKYLTTITVFALGTALAATPVFAADGSTAGSKAASAPTVSRDAPFTPPGKSTPRAPLQVDASSLSRGPLALDPAKAIDSMATLTLSRDGTVSETPASEGMRAVIESSMKGSNPTMSTDRVISAPDQRKQITDSSTYPAITTGWIWSQDQKGDWYTCTGTLIGPKTVITAAHCVYDHATGGWAKALTFIPGATDAQTAPFGQVDWANANILKGFVDNYDGTNYGSIMPWDLAEIELADDTGNQLGWMGFRVDDASDFKATLLGYPGDKPDGTMWMTQCDVKPDQFGDQIYWHDCETVGGNSGSAMWEDKDGKGDLYVRGINVAGDEKVNYGLRLIDPYYQFLVDNYK